MPIVKRWRCSARGLMLRFVLMLTAVFSLAGAGSAGSWLDGTALTNWNTPQAQLPARPGAPDADLAPGGHCAAGVRPATSPEDRLVNARGWALVGPYQRFGSLSVLMATSSADGMCRPDGFQGFVFVNGVFAGTVSPQLMHARTDASINAEMVSIFSSTEFLADFSRYGNDDPLCCPHATTTVTFRIRSLGGKPRAVPIDASTQKSSA